MTEDGRIKREEHERARIEFPYSLVVKKEFRKKMAYQGCLSL